MFCHILYCLVCFFYYLNVSFSRLITLVEEREVFEERVVFSAINYTYFCCFCLKGAYERLHYFTVAFLYVGLPYNFFIRKFQFSLQAAQYIWFLLRSSMNKQKITLIFVPTSIFTFFLHH